MNKIPVASSHLPITSAAVQTTMFLWEIWAFREVMNCEARTFGSATALFCPHSVHILLGNVTVFRSSVTAAWIHAFARSSAFGRFRSPRLPVRACSGS